MVATAGGKTTATATGSGSTSTGLLGSNFVAFSFTSPFSSFGGNSNNNQLNTPNTTSSTTQQQHQQLSNITSTYSQIFPKVAMSDIGSLSASNEAGGGHSNATIVKEGWLQKRGEHIKTWRSRYFILRSDGTLHGWRSKPNENAPPERPLNDFTIKGCQIMTVDRPRPFTFIIRGLQWTSVVERTFSVDTERERQEWTDAIR